MKFDQPAGINPIDQLKVVGQPTPRIEGPLKTTGTAAYAYERHDVVANQAYGYIVGATIAKGRIRLIDTSLANAAPGVLAVVTAENAGKLDQGDRNAILLLAGPTIQHYHQAIAVVVAETFEQARAAAALIRVDYERVPGSFDLEEARKHAPVADPIFGFIPSETRFGDFEGAFAAAPVRIDTEYRTPDQSHAMMEPHASIAAWDGDKLTLWTSTQSVASSAAAIATTLGLPPEYVRISSPYVGGGFGAKLSPRADTILAAVGARAAGRPVKVAIPRPLTFNNTTHRPATVQRVRIGCEKEGKITAIAHESWSGNLPGGNVEMATLQTRLLYAGDNRLTSHYFATLDLPEGNAMRAPGEASGMMALEIAMDEMAEKLGMDPVRFRAINDTQVDPEAAQERPFSQRQLIRCMEMGAERFGWNRRTAPATRREDRWLVGMGMAAAFRNNHCLPSRARARLDSRGMVTVETDMTDIGTGSYTIIAQTAAETVGLPIERVEVRLGDSDFPVSCGSGGQFGAQNSTAGVYAACMKLREAIAQQLGFNSPDATFEGGTVRVGKRSVPLAQAASDGELVAEDGIEYGEFSLRYQQSTFGAHFVEVGVDAATAEIRVRRMLAVCAAGRILNPTSARSQVIGSMTMGVGAALMEELAVDKRFGLFVNHDLAGYEVPVHADIPHQDVIFLDEVDPFTSPMKAKGVGELGLCGVGAAIANAVYNATGVRVRDYPVTLEKLLDKLPNDF